MKLSGRKFFGFIIVDIQLILIVIAMFIFIPESVVAALATILFAMLGNLAIFIGGNTLDKWQKSANFVPTLNRQQAPLV